MDAKALELYKQYLIERLGLIFDDDATDSKEYDNKMRKYIKFLPPKKEEKVAPNSEEKIEIVSEEVPAASKEEKVSKEPGIVKYNGIYYIEYPDGSRKPLSYNIDYIDHFKDGFALVKKDGKYNFIDTEGKIISEEWFDYIYDFHGGFAKIFKNGRKYNLIDTQGKLIFEEWFDFIADFHDGFARVRKDGEHYDEYNLIDTQGKLLFEEWVDYVGNFEDGFATVKNGRKYNLIDTQGKLISEEWFDSIGYFRDGFAIVTRYGRCNLIDIQGKLISKKWFNDVDSFIDGFAKVKEDGKYNFIDTEGKIISKEWFDYIDSFIDGFAKVKKDGKYNFIDTQGKLISKEWYDFIDDFVDGYAFVTQFNREKGDHNYIDKQGKLVADGMFGRIEFFKKYNIFLAMTVKGVFYITDTDGNMILLNNWITEHDVRKGMVKSYPNFFDIAGTVKCKKIDMGKYQVKKVLGGYKCDDGVSNFKVKYEPIKKFGFRYTLCFNNDTHELYLHDRAGNHYIQLGSYRNIVYDDYFIIDNKHKKIYLIYANTFTDITEYYLANLADKEKLKITMGCDSIMTFDEFCASNLSKILGQHEKEQTDIRMARQRANLEEEKLKQEQIEKEKLAKMEAEKLKDKKQKKESDEKQKEALEMLKSALLVLSQVQDGKIERVRFDNIFVQVGDHLEIASVFRTSLKFIDLSQIDFANVDIHGVDFSGCNLGIFFDPQKVYNKDLSGCNFEKVYFSPMANFTGVDIRGCRFSEDDDPRTIDYFHVTFSGAIYDETTTYNGIPFTELIKETRGSGTSRATS